ncbi:hypothetical protein AVEN_217958-1 [Araneus ventricosus]|uniref:Uncharacterized protein n=1 Tax=Araneus ventricosus TaxID=182803 RepID=A0A4Y2IKC2_ARAVE|nr:hypothetical protein AVEN_217958-1 [Araneus ventricosus]
MRGKGLPREPLLLRGRSFGRRVLSNVTLSSLRQYFMEPITNNIVSLAKIRGLEADSNDTEELVEKHNQRAGQRRFFEVALCFTERSCGGEFVRGGGKSKATIFYRNRRNAESTENCCIVHREASP